MGESEYKEKIVGKQEEEPTPRVVTPEEVVNLFDERVAEVKQLRTEVQLLQKREHPFWMSVGRMLQLPTDFYATGMLREEAFLTLHRKGLEEMSNDGRIIAMKMPKNMPSIHTTPEALKYLEGLSSEARQLRDACDVFVPESGMTRVQYQVQHFRKYLMTLGRAAQATKDMFLVGLIDADAYVAIDRRNMSTLAARVVGVT